MVSVEVSLPTDSQTLHNDHYVTYTSIASTKLGAYGPLSVLCRRASLGLGPIARIILHFETRFTKLEVRSGDLKIFPKQNVPILPIENFRWARQLRGVDKGYAGEFMVRRKQPESSSTGLVEITLHLDISKDTAGLSADLLKLYRSGENADVTFSIGGKELKGHKVIVGARSDCFRAMFASATKENETGVVEVVDFEPEVFEEGLHFLYSGETAKTMDGELAMSLLPWADKYLVESLKQICVSKIKNCLDKEKVFDALALANQINCVTLRDACFRVMNTDMSESERWRILLALGDQDLTSEFLKIVD